MDLMNERGQAYQCWMRVASGYLCQVVGVLVVKVAQRDQDFSIGARRSRVNARAAGAWEGRIRRVRQPHGSARHGKQTDCWYYTMPDTKKRGPLFDEDGQRVRGKGNKEAAELALAREKLSWQGDRPGRPAQMVTARPLR